MNVLLTKQSNFLLKDPKVPDLKEKREAEQTIKQFERKSEIVSRQVSINLERQNSLVFKRCQDRKLRNGSEEKKRKSLQNGFSFELRTTALNRKVPDFSFDASAGRSLVNEAEGFERELERIMEDSVLEKLMRIREIKKKYEKAIEDVGEEKGIFKQVVDEIRKNMENDIRMLEVELEKKRKQEICEIKQKYFQTFNLN